MRRLCYIVLCLLFFFVREEFLIAEEVSGKERIRIELKRVKVSDVINMLPDDLRKFNYTLIEKDNALVAELPAMQRDLLTEFIALVDIKSRVRVMRLSYIQGKEVLEYLPPSVQRENIVLTRDPNIIFFVGTKEQEEEFEKELGIIDSPVSQIRYQLLVVQYQKSDNLNWAKSLSFEPTEKSAASKISGNMSNVFNINFDIISKFGYQFAFKLNFEIGQNKARVLADTTLNGLSGERIKFQNTNTFRYLDTAVDPSTGKPLYSSALREITSGLMVNLKGDVSGKGMITVEIHTQVSKQGRSDGTSRSLPPTSEKIVSTKVRSKSGDTIIIGGLLQVEESEVRKKLPGLADIPVLGLAFQDISKNSEVTEMVLYLVPYVHLETSAYERREWIRFLYEKYAGGQGR